MNLYQLCSLSIEHWDAICECLLQPDKEGRRWPAGSSLDEPGRLFGINVRTELFGDSVTKDIK